MRLPLQQLEKCIPRVQGMETILSPDHIGIIDITSPPSEDKKKMTASLLKILTDILLEEKVCGMKNIFKADYMSDSHSRKFVTVGTNLKDILPLEFVDSRYTISTSIKDVYETLGIEAARAVIVEEMTKAVFGSAYYKDKHVNLQADLMTQSGELIPINKAGVDKQSNSFLKSASYERTIAQLKQAGFGATDNVETITSSIIVGSMPKIGTASKS